MLRTPVNNAKMTAATEYEVLICPVTPTDVPNELPMSMRRRAAKTEIGPEAKLEAVKAGRNNLLKRESGTLESASTTGLPLSNIARAVSYQFPLRGVGAFLVIIENTEYRSQLRFLPLVPVTSFNSVMVGFCCFWWDRRSRRPQFGKKDRVD
jgi:hypothetical protein